MPFRFLDDAPTADVGFVASGETFEACLRSAADATLEVMLSNPNALRRRERRTLHVESESADLVVLKLLEDLIYYKDAESLFLRITEVHAVQHADRWIVDAIAEGEPIDRLRHQLSADVKAVTLHRLNVQRIDGEWHATVVLDI